MEKISLFGLLLLFLFYKLIHILKLIKEERSRKKSDKPFAYIYDSQACIVVFFALS